MDNVKNELIKREYVEGLKQVACFSEKTIRIFENAMAYIDDVLAGKDYARMTKDDFIKYKETLRGKLVNGHPVSKTTVVNHLVQVYKFFKWLINMPGYKSSLDLGKIQYLKPTRQELQAQRNRGRGIDSSFEDIERLFHSILAVTEIDFRDRAAVAFLALTGIRVEAFLSLPIKAIDPENWLFMQDPNQGVRTKFGKCILGKVHDLNESDAWFY